MLTSSCQGLVRSLANKPKVPEERGGAAIPVPQAVAPLISGITPSTSFFASAPCGRLWSDWLAGKGARTDLSASGQQIEQPKPANWASYQPVSFKAAGFSLGSPDLMEEGEAF